MTKNWWKEAVVYQVYPRSFKDSNADGIGDLRGLTSQLDYLKELGVDVIWLSPHFKSPNADNGYDISDYEAIMEDFGSMADFDELLAEIHARGLKLIIDLVVNHSSDEHHWFQEARKSKQNPYRDYYIWKAPAAPQPPMGELTKTPPSGVGGLGAGGAWISFFSGSAWELEPLTNEYYLHLFLKKQPDLNWENPKLRQEIYKMMRFWLDKGVNGFRMDVISLISKDPTFPDFPDDRLGDLNFYANGPRVHEFLQEMNREVLAKYDCLTVGEAFGVSATQAVDYVGESRQELNMIYHFDHAVPRNEICFAKPEPEFTVVELKAIFNKWDTALANDGWNTVYLGNHDNPRMLSRFGDVEKYRTESAKMLATLLLTLRGTPYLYQGDEIGMSNCYFETIEEFNDVQVLNAYETLVTNGEYANQQFMQAANYIARDHARTPMQWTNAPQAGFTTAPKSWLKVNPNYPTVHVEAACNNPHSVWHYYKTLIQIRKANTALVYGTYEDVAPEHPQIWAYTRKLENETWLIVCNFSGETSLFELPAKLSIEKSVWIMGNYAPIGIRRVLNLKPFETLIYRLFRQDAS